MMIVVSIVFSFVSLAFRLAFRLALFRMSYRIAPGRLVSVTIPSVIDVHDGVGPPIGMKAFVIVEAPEADVVAPNPDMVRSKVDIRAAHETDKFDAVPDITIRDEDYGGIGRYDNRRRLCLSGTRQRLDYLR